MQRSDHIEGIIVDGSLLVSGNDENAPRLTDGAQFLLTKLRYSNIHTGICCGMGLSVHKARFLESTAKLYSFKCFVNVSSVDETINEITVAWHGNRGRFLFVASTRNEELLLKLCSHNWLIIIPRFMGSELGDGFKTASISSTVLYVDKLEEVPFTVCQLNRKVAA